MLNLDERRFEYVRPLEWDEVFAIWRDAEAHKTNWIAHYTERGFSSWEQWRRRYTEPLELAGRDWHLYRIRNPFKAVPQFHGGPYRTWMERHYGDKTSPTFAELAAREDMQNHDGIREIIEHFPAETTLIGLVQNGTVIIAEGMHRCVAVALAARESAELDSDISIALADASGEKLPTVGQYGG